MKFLVLVVSLALTLAGCKRPADPVEEKPAEPAESPGLNVGVILPMSGPKEAFGAATLDGIKLALEKANAGGGLAAGPLRPVVVDSRSTPEGAAEAVRELQTAGVIAIIGEVTSENTLAAVAVAAQGPVPFVSPGATHADVTRAGPNIFRVCYTDPFPGTVMSKFASSLGVTRAAVLFDPSDPYAMGLVQSFSDDFVARGGTIVARESYEAAAGDLRAPLEAIKSRQPEIVFLPAYFGQAAAMIRQARALGIDVPFLGTDGWESAAFLDAAGADANNSYFASHFSADEESGRVAAFVEEFQKIHGRKPEALAALGYDAASLLIDALRRAGSAEAGPLTAALAATEDFPGVTGTITPGADRNPRKPAIVIRVEEGKFRYLETVDP